MQVVIEDGHVDLAMDEWAAADCEDVIETTGASTCGVVAVLNHSQGKAWMVHQTAPFMLLDDTEEMLADAAATSLASDNVMIWMAGCGSGGTQAADHEALMEMVSSYFPNTVQKYDWGREDICFSYDPTSALWKLV